MTEEEMRMFIRLQIIKKYKRFKTFSTVHNFSPSQVNFWLSGRVKMPVHLLNMFGLERVVTVVYKEKEQENEQRNISIRTGIDRHYTEGNQRDR